MWVVLVGQGSDSEAGKTFHTADLSYFQLLHAHWLTGSHFWGLSRGFLQSSTAGGVSLVMKMGAITELTEG